MNYYELTYLKIDRCITVFINKLINIHMRSYNLDIIYDEDMYRIHGYENKSYILLDGDGGVVDIKNISFKSHHIDPITLYDKSYKNLLLKNGHIMSEEDWIYVKKTKRDENNYVLITNKNKKILITEIYLDFFRRKYYIAEV